MNRKTTSTKPAAAPNKPGAAATKKSRSRAKASTNKPDAETTQATQAAGSATASGPRPPQAENTVKVHKLFAIGLVGLSDRCHNALGKEAAMRLREALDKAVLPLAVFTDTDAFEITLALMAPETVFPVMPGGRAKQPAPADRAEKGERANRANRADRTDMAPKSPNKNSPLRKAT
ncbi:hypothetical protein [Hydrogenophaga sp.]|uniref:hypothetical protein n=1 Tax=Hydrogenophaga sp. TaxID=1904254 RepID=UPI002718F8B0|nr:hypothetical protein [Hydrogenophaga sp.]MDO8905636.1 hypothetical protein [Hydrogenophaga sp.]